MNIDKQIYISAAALILLLHLSWILFVIAGAFFTRRRPRLTALHIVSLVWGIIVESGPLPCPLTMAENFFEAKAGQATYSGSFLVHYLDRTIYPDLSWELIATCGVAVCAVNLAIYGFRWWRWRKGRRS